MKRSQVDLINQDLEELKSTVKNSDFEINSTALPAEKANKKKRLL
jgi:hypothetical protein